MSRSYAKGYRAELELVHELAKRGFVAIRSPRSGRISLPAPDVIAAKRGRLFAFECKFKDRSFVVDKCELDQLRSWKRIGGAHCFVAWKRKRRGWYFIPLDVVLKEKGRVNIRLAEKYGRDIDWLTRHAST